ncbi:hypothetical protein BH23GEM11_BH23GEM11_05080 [soil metagenome]
MKPTTQPRRDGRWVTLRAAMAILAAGALLVGIALVSGVPLAAQAAQASQAGGGPSPRLIHGEALHYTGDFGMFGKVGSGVMRVSAPRCERGRPMVRLDFNFSGRVMLMNIRDETSSWVHPTDLMSFRYHKEERHPMGSRTERVEIHPEQGLWEAEGDVARALDPERPLDELSFIFLARSLNLEAGEMVEFDRHFDPARSPVRMRDRGRETVRVPAGEFRVRVVEMEVNDPSRFGDAGRVTLYLTDDADRVPVKIATAMPVVGSLVLVLEKRTVERTAAAGSGATIPSC